MQRTQAERQTCPCIRCGETAIKQFSLPQHKVHTLNLMERLPPGADEASVWQNKAVIEKQMASGDVQIDTSHCLPELRPDTKVKTIH